MIGNLTTHVTAVVWVDWRGARPGDKWTRVPVETAPGFTYPNMAGAILALDPHQDRGHTYISPKEVADRLRDYNRDMGLSPRRAYPWVDGCPCLNCEARFLATLTFGDRS